jgi:hypothetical protein
VGAGGRGRRGGRRAAAGGRRGQQVPVVLGHDVGQQVVQGQVLVELQSEGGEGRVGRG